MKTTGETYVEVRPHRGGTFAGAKAHKATCTTLRPETRPRIMAETEVRRAIALGTFCTKCMKGETLEDHPVTRGA